LSNAASAVARRTGGRPTADAAVRLEESILDQATVAFLRDGYSATTIEAIARSCHVAKRTIYARWNGKAVLFRAVLERLITRWLATGGDWDDTDGLEAALRKAAGEIMAVALTPEAVALHRLIVAESERFPELPLILHQAGASEGTIRLIAMLERAVARGELAALDTALAAEQFMHLLLAGPQSRALGLGRRLDKAEMQTWADQAVRLFLLGVRSLRLLQPVRE
jgi:AcrR family transcriptional regulator